MSRRFWLFALALATLPLAMFVLRNVQVSALTKRGDELRARAVLDAYALVDGDLRSIQTEMLELGNMIANSPIVRQGLDDARLVDGPTSNPLLVEYLADLELPANTAIEIHTPVPRLVAWLGFSMPLDDAPARLQFLEGIQTAISTDSDKRDALVMWVPVRTGPTIYGGIRVVRMLRSVAPVQNAYLQDYDVVDNWARQSSTGLRVVYTAPFDDVLPESGDVRLLRGIDGSVLGRVFVDRPTGEQLVQRVRDRHNDVIAFWVAVLAVWLLAGAFSQFRRAVKSVDVRGGLRQLSIRFGVLLFGLVGFRFVLLALDLPNRLQRGKSPLAPLFDPTHFAATIYFGTLRSIGDVAVTAIVVSLVGIVCYNFVATALGRIQPVALEPASNRHRFSALGVTLASASLAAVLVSFLNRITNQIVLDSTLDYFARTGLIPENLVLTVFVELLLLGLGVAMIFGATLVAGVAGYRFFVGSGYRLGRVATISVLSVVAFGLVSKWSGLFDTRLNALALLVTLFLVGSGFVGYRWYQIGVRAMTLRNTLLAILWITSIVYPLLYRGLDVQRRDRLIDAVESFDDGRDPRVLFAIDRILLDADESVPVRSFLVSRSAGNAEAQPDGQARRSSTYALPLDSIATNILRRSLLASMGNYEVSLTLFDHNGSPVGRYYESDQRLTSNALADLERSDYETMLEMHTAAGVDGAVVEPMTGRRERERFRYQGLLPVSDDDQIVGWIMASAEPRTVIDDAVTPFPRVLVPAGFYGNLQGDVSLAEYRDGLLVRNTGSGFSRYRLTDDALAQLQTSTDVWRRELDRGKKFDTYYHRRADESRLMIGVQSEVVVASRMSAVTIFDHLYYILRLTVAGLYLGLPIYLFGLVRRRASGLLPAPVVRFRDKVLNAFFGVGLVTVAAMGFVGLQVVTGENERAIESWLKQHLERVEKTLFMEARAGELAYSVMSRTSIDSLSARVGLDLNLYRGTELVSSSRPQLVEDRLIDRRLPMPAYKALFFDGFRFTATDEHVGEFAYTAGFRALTDEDGQPHYVLSVPTLPEQERIEEERATTIAYLFGALLLLVLVVLGTASVLANALTRPIMRLREGLEAVSRGQFTRITPFESRDEFGELVQTFNSMQDQLADSRRKVAQQERQLAWREMARQVAHEIKNPLTPMKLSIQHLRRSFDSSDDRDSSQFKGLFSRITTTLVEQIDALARIANEFSSFARMPQRVLELLDLNSVIREAAALMEAEEGISIGLHLADAPLIVNADREELRRIYINLIKNGIQAVPEDREGRIEIMTRRDPAPAGDEHEFVAYSEVVDNGSGVPDELRARIFEPNFSTKTSGTGLGLAIVRKAIEDMNGEIGFRTKPGEGSTFWIRLGEERAAE